MIIVMQKQASAGAVTRVIECIRSRGLQEHVSQGEERTIIGAVGDERVFHPNELERLPEVERAIRVLNDWKIISREAQPQDSLITVRGVVFGGEKMLDIAVGFKPDADAVFIDPFFMSARPYADVDNSSEKAQIIAMQQEIEHIHEAGKPVLVRIRDVRQIESALAAQADILYLGGELMSNRALQDEVGRLNTPVVLCKDKHHRVDDWLVAAEHIALRGNHHIILGEAGTLSFEPEHAYRLDVDAIVRVRKVTHLPVIANITGLWHSDMPQEVLYRLSVASGANGVASSLG
ncbi:chorismate mutase [Neisseria yangbaofengii]|uniref:chorismate mutase n=1 Tax=Neisseria yangbaofengii TaxID=2709396 RepID=UPI0013EAA1DF|nr:chorismate mutase [Neisseria yangbaofengii]